MPTDLIPLHVRYAVRAAIGGWGPYTVRQIYELFTSYGFAEATDYDASGGQRRAQVEAFHAAIDWTSSAQTDRYLRLVQEVLGQLTGDDDSDHRRERLTGALKRADILPDEKGRLRLPPSVNSSVNLSNLTTESDIRLHLERLSRLDQEPEEMIGAAKDLIEATAKHVLIELGKAPGAKADVPGLSKEALAALNLHPAAIAPTATAADVITRMLGGLAQIAVGMAELRNQGYGVGHGRGRRIPGIKRRHGEFAARAAVAYVAMVLDTLHDPDAPWRKSADR